MSQQYDEELLNRYFVDASKNKYEFEPETSGDNEYEGHESPVHSQRFCNRSRKMITMPTPPPIIKRIVEREPTPERSIVEKVIVSRQPQTIIKRIIERPRTPPPKIIYKRVVKPARAPIVTTRVKRVDYSRRYSNCCYEDNHYSASRIHPATLDWLSGYYDSYY